MLVRNEVYSREGVLNFTQESPLLANYAQIVSDDTETVRWILQIQTSF